MTSQVISDFSKRHRLAWNNNRFYIISSYFRRQPFTSCAKALNYDQINNKGIMFVCLGWPRKHVSVIEYVNLYAGVSPTWVSPLMNVKYPSNRWMLNEGLKFDSEKTWFSTEIITVFASIERKWELNSLFIQRLRLTLTPQTWTLLSP